MGGGEEVEFWLWIPGGCMAKYLEYVISSLCPVCFACAWGVGVGLGRMRWGIVVEVQGLGVMKRGKGLAC